MEISYKKTRGRPRSGTDNKSTSTVQALDRGLFLLSNLSQCDQATLTELSMRTGIPPSSAHRFLSTMESHGIVQFDDVSQQWRIGVGIMKLSGSFIRRSGVIDVGRPILRELMEESGKTANMAIEDNGDVVLVAQVETQEAIRAYFKLGERGPMHASGIGKVLLADKPMKEIKLILQQKGMASFTPKTLTSPSDLFCQLDDVRAQGWSLDDEERYEGMKCIASAVYNEFGEAIAGVSISGPTVCLGDEVIGEVVPMVKRFAKRITENIGGKVPGE